MELKIKVCGKCLYYLGEVVHSGDKTKYWLDVNNFNVFGFDSVDSGLNIPVSFRCMFFSNQPFSRRNRGVYNFRTKFTDSPFDYGHIGQIYLYELMEYADVYYKMYDFMWLCDKGMPGYSGQTQKYNELLKDKKEYEKINKYLIPNLQIKVSEIWDKLYNIIQK